MNQCQWKGAQFDGLKLRLKTEDLGYRWLKKGCFGYQALGSYCLAVPQANHCSEFRIPQWSILLNCLWPIAKAIFVNKVQILNITQSLVIYPWNPHKFTMKTYLTSTHKIGNNISRTNLKASRNKAVLVLQREWNRNKPRYKICKRSLDWVDKYLF